MFDELTIRDARPILWLKRLFVVVIVLLLIVGGRCRVIVLTIRCEVWS